MTWEIYTAYVVACTVLLVIPGPTIMLVVSYAMTRGRRTGLYSVPGVILGDVAALVLSLAGLGALLALSAGLFTALKLAGAAYLVWLGIQMWRAAAKTSSPAGRDGGFEPMAVNGRDGWAIGMHSFVVTALNPKGIAFFIAFLPQFIVPAAPVMPQLVLLGTTFVILGGVNAALYAVLAGSLVTRLNRPGWHKAIHRIGGTFLIGAGAAMAAMRRAG